MFHQSIYDFKSMTKYQVLSMLFVVSICNEENADFQLEISENINVMIFLCNFKDPLSSAHGHS